MKIKFLLFVLILISPALAQSADFKGSLTAHNRYLPPVSNPLFNETPYITTEIRPILLLNKIPDEFVSSGGDIRIIAAEIRVALNDKLGIIATKDGYADIDFESALPDETGSANVSLGLKYALYSEPETNSIVSIGFEYEAPVGTLETAGIDLQGQGDGFVDLFSSAATTWGRWGLQGNIGYNIALDSDHDSSMLHVSAHLDYQVNDYFYPLVELNTFSVRKDGDRLPFDFEGIDIVNFGSTDAGTVTTMAIGARFVINDNLLMGFAYEAPISNRKDLMDDRYYFDLVIHL